MPAIMDTSPILSTLSFHISISVNAVSMPALLALSLAPMPSRAFATAEISFRCRHIKGWRVNSSVPGTTPLFTQKCHISTTRPSSKAIQVPKSSAILSALWLGGWLVAWASWFGLETGSALENDVAERFTKNT